MKAKTVKISELTPDNINANKGTARGSAMLEKSLRDYGAGRSVLVDKAGRIIAGNKTIEAAGSIGLDNALMVETDGSQVVIVKRTDLDLDSPQGRGLAIADNRVAEVGLEWDLEALEKIGEELDLGEFWFDEELPEIDFGSIDEDEDDEPTGDADAVPEIEDVPTSKRGDLWILGEHRVLCGDSTSAEDVARLMNGERADMTFTDPPYNIDYSGLTGDFEKIRNDKMPDLEFVKFLKDGIFKSDIMYVCCSWQYCHLFREALVSEGVKIKSLIVWDKVNPAQNLDKYFKQHELIWYSGPLGGCKTLRGDVWQLKRQRNTMHPTMKPIELICMAISDHPDVITIVDSFLGSGSTLIAAEQMGRRCYGMELDPQYVDVIIKRWQDYTGKEATHEDGRTFAQVSEERASDEAQEAED